MGGWTHGHYITNLFVFTVDGRIVDSVYNVPGAMHDSTLAIWGGTYERLKEIHEETGGKCVVDSAFAANQAPYLIKSAQDVTKADGRSAVQVMVQATSLRQAAEWGMRAIQGSMPRLKDKIKFETWPSSSLLI